MYKSKFQELSQKIRTTSCDWLFTHILFNTEPQKDNKSSAYVEGFIQMGFILTIMDLAEEGTSSDVIDMVLAHYNNELPNELNVLHKKFLTFQKWLQTRKPEPNLDSKEFYSLITMRIIEQYYGAFSEDRPTAFHIIEKTKNDINHILKSDPTRILSIYGFILANLLHSRLIDPKSDIHAQTSYLLLLKAQEKINRDLLPRWEKSNGIAVVDRMLLKCCYIYAARIKALLGDPNESLELLKKAQFHGEITNPESIINNPDFKDLQKNTQFITLLSETPAQSKERIAFEKDFAKYNSNPLYGSPNTPILERSITESQILRNALSRSTVNFLTDPLLPKNFNLLDFFQPVVNTLHSEAKNRLNSRMALYGVKADKEIPGDGNCQMYSLSDQLCGNLNHAKYIRRTLVNWLKNNAEISLSNGCTLKDFVHDQSWDNYCQKMLKDGEWGDHLTLIAAAEVFQAVIIIISSIPGDNYVIEIIPTFTAPQRTIMLSHFAEFHYGSVHPI